MEIQAFSIPTLRVKKGDVLCSTFSQYTALEILGHGSFGQVIKCQNMSTNSTMAVKILLDAQAVAQAEEEVNMLRQINSLNHPNLLRFFENFQYLGYRCMVFEMLHKDLHNAIVSEDLDMQLTEIRAIARQLFSALDALSDAGILHTDIKSDNVMFVGKGDLKVKLIDFGLAFYDGDAPTGTIIQPVSYRSPEILLGLPFSHGIDMWATGCLLVFLYLQHHLFRESSSYGMMRQIVQLLGQPDDKLLSAGMYTRKYFVPLDASEGSAWRLKTPEEYAANSGAEGDQNVKDSVLKSLDELVDVYEFVSLAEQEDRLQFVDLVKSMLNLDGTKRISAFQAGNHSFIMMSHLSDPRDKAYLEDSEEKMSCCYRVDSEDEQQCEEESDEDRQVCEEFEDGEEEPERRGWKQPNDYKWEQTSVSDWERSSVSDWERSSVSDWEQSIDYKLEQTNVSDWEQSSVSDWERSSVSDWEQSFDYKLEQINVSDWEQSDDSGWNETDSVDLDFESKERVYVPEATTPSMEEENSLSEIIAMAGSGLAGMTCPPSASMKGPDRSTKKSAWNSFTKTLQTFWRNVKPLFCCFC